MSEELKQSNSDLKTPQKQKQQTNAKKLDLVGLYYHGLLEGVEVVQSGEIDGNKYGASIKLNFSTLEKIVKKIGNEELSTMAKRNFKLSIDSKDSELVSSATEWNEKIGTYLSVKLMPIKDGTYKISKD